jgi:hypothetical protein
VFFNALEKPENKVMPDLSRRELVILGPMLALMIWIGVQPSVFLQKMEPSVRHLLELVTDNGLQAHVGDGEEAVVTFASTNPLENEGVGDESPAVQPGDEE